ncbi:MAG: hypothetical protein M1826_006005 [Phylliscum demangeonii]|nr:MAG: hypothetical protein M1826_006005 [Phylliscum demangeonii]
MLGVAAESGEESAGVCETVNDSEATETLANRELPRAGPFALAAVETSAGRTGTGVLSAWATPVPAEARIICGEGTAGNDEGNTNEAVVFAGAGDDEGNASGAVVFTGASGGLRPADADVPATGRIGAGAPPVAVARVVGDAVSLAATGNARGRSSPVVLATTDVPTMGSSTGAGARGREDGSATSDAVALFSAGNGGGASTRFGPVALDVPVADRTTGVRAKIVDDGAVVESFAAFENAGLAATAAGGEKVVGVPVDRISGSESTADGGRVETADAEELAEVRKARVDAAVAVSSVTEDTPADRKNAGLRTSGVGDDDAADVVVFAAVPTPCNGGDAEGLEWSPTAPVAKIRGPETTSAVGNDSAAVVPFVGETTRGPLRAAKANSPDEMAEPDSDGIAGVSDGDADELAETGAGPVMTVTVTIATLRGGAADGNGSPDLSSSGCVASKLVPENVEGDAETVDDTVESMAEDEDDEDVVRLAASTSRTDPACERLQSNGGPDSTSSGVDEADGVAIAPMKLRMPSETAEMKAEKAGADEVVEEGDASNVDAVAGNSRTTDGEDEDEDAVAKTADGDVDEECATDVDANGSLVSKTAVSCDWLGSEVDVAESIDADNDAEPVMLVDG